VTVPVTEPFSGQAPQPGQDEGRLVAALLDNIRSTFNVGAMFRTADGAGLRRLHLGGISATPDNPKVAKTALGAEAVVPWRYFRNGLDAARDLQARGYRLWALESSPRSQPLFHALPQDEGAPIAFVVGNEKAGVDPGILALCERHVHIPMQGAKESLNVAIAFGVAAYFLRFGRMG
jgi:tRNA G18 (ribose-2'-O)-methylase SpoU